MFFPFPTFPGDEVFTCMCSKVYTAEKGLCIIICGSCRITSTPESSSPQDGNSEPRGREGGRKGRENFLLKLNGFSPGQNA